MIALLRNPLTLVWAALAVATLASYETAAGGRSFAIVMLVAGLKSHLISWYFMDLRAAHRGWAIAFAGLAAAAVAAIIALHFIAAAHG